MNGTSMFVLHIIVICLGIANTSRMIRRIVTYSIYPTNGQFFGPLDKLNE